MTPILISPSEGRNRQELLSVKLKQPLDECKLQNFRRDEGREGPVLELAGAGTDEKVLREVGVTRFEQLDIWTLRT